MSIDSKSIFDPNPQLADDLFIFACKRLGFDSGTILMNLKNRNLQHLILENMFCLIDRPKEHSMLAAAIVMWNLYRSCPLTVRDYVRVFQDHLRPDVICFMNEYADELQAELQFEKDFDMSYFAAGTLFEQYLSRLKYDEDPMEIPQMAWMRVAIGEFCSRRMSKSRGDINDRENLKIIIRIYHRYANREISPASPTIFNMGFKTGAPSSCMIYSIADDMDDILKLPREAGNASKNNCGSGVDFSNLRHSRIGRSGLSKGIVPLLKIWDDLTDYIDQGGRRPGATTASLKIQHLDIPEFIRLRDQVGEDKTKVTKLNTSIMLCDLFFKRCQEGGKWTLFCPKQTKGLNLLHGKKFEEQYVIWEQKAQVWIRYKKYRALKNLRETTDLESNLWKNTEELFEELSSEFRGKPIPEEVESREFLAEDIHDEIADIRIKAGMPYIAHGDNINRKNNMDNEGPVLGLNLCQEITIPAIPGKQTGCCNLHTISLKTFVENKQFNFIRFGEAVQDAVLCLNQVIDESHNISKKARLSNERNRPIGLGPTGLADVFALMDLPVVDPHHLPRKIGQDEDGDPIYEFISIEDGTPDYSDDALKERVINPQVDELNWKIWCCKYYNALLSSLKEAKRCGPYPTFWSSHTAKGELQFHLWKKEAEETGREYPFPLDPLEPSEWGQEGSWVELIEKIKTHGLRNALLLTVMPSSTKAQIVDDVESVELPMQNVYVRKVLSGDYPVLNFHMVQDLDEIGMWNEKTYNQMIESNGSILSLSEDGLNKSQKIRLRFFKEKHLTMFEVPQKIILWMTARRQVVIDHSQSTNIYLKQPTKEIIKAMDKLTNEWGMKTGMYYLRSRSSGDALRIKNVPENQQLSHIEHEAKMLNESEVKLNIHENTDEQMDEIMRLVKDAQTKYQAQEVDFRENIVSQTLMSASRPEEVQVCNLGENCVSCQ